MAALETYSEYLGMKSFTKSLEVIFEFRLVDRSHLKGLSGRFRQAHQLNQLIQFSQGNQSQAKCISRCFVSLPKVLKRALLLKILLMRVMLKLTTY